MSTVTAAAVITAVREVAAERPMHIYGSEHPDHSAPETCVYASYERQDDGTLTATPECLVGHAFARLGVLDRLSPEGDWNSDAGTVMRDTFKQPLSDEVCWLDAAQDQQDAGKSWAWCVEYADRYWKVGA